MSSAVETMRGILQRIATGPEMSKDISFEEARQAMHWVLEGKIDPVQSAIFLVALRMKRETDDEFRGVLQAIRDDSRIVTADVDEVFDVSDPYNGYSRCLPISAFLPLVLASCGIPSVSHGLETVGPKFGVTHRQVLRAAGCPVDLTPEQAADRVADQSIAWAYLDQSAFCPSLHELVDLRTRIVKRPVISTVESLVGPVRGRSKTHVVTGYVHKAYPRIYELLARHAGFDSALIVRGVEGGVMPSLRQASTAWQFVGDSALEAVTFDPTELGIEQQGRSVPIPDSLSLTGNVTLSESDRQAIATVTAETGIAALKGEPGPARDSLICMASLCLWHLQRYESPVTAASAVAGILDSGIALHRIGNGLATD